MTTHRIEALTDGIFAISMTLLVLTLALPEAEKGITEVHNLLIGQSDKFFNYALSFVLLAVFWMGHHQQSHLIKRTDGRHLWINIFFLMFVGLMPFTTSLVGDYSNDSMAELSFAINIFMLGILLALNWVYATNHHRLVDNSLDSRSIALGKKRGVITPLVAVLAMGIAFINPWICSFLYLLIPILQQVIQYRHRRMKGGAV